ncbi:hypothetical protein SSP35_19_00690 [Streptomyces sp. NBRC 110611]|uniref:hypothetical protein n=1 Tax=Streptomyces sp. NBRC 110611 TaxID=1621259 RepID=UPI00082F225C|nr:hypothetical protein [Streptomyces sp. NBRC 110611]GAU70432.1 hypothetical protein SSP35_19_00690 [Streptomyces sp. NBRC 110611]
MHVPEEIRADAAALIDSHARGRWKPGGTDRQVARALFRFLETGAPLTGEQVRSVLAHAAPPDGAGDRLPELLRRAAGLLDDAETAEGPAGRDAVDHVCLLLDAVALTRPADR